MFFESSPVDMSSARRDADRQRHCLPASRVLRMTLPGAHRQTYFLYLPVNVSPTAPVFVTVHGISRNAREHAERFAPFAERHGVVLVAPRFGRKRFPRYQRLTPDARGHAPDALLDAIVDDVRRLLGLLHRPIHLFGFSGGGQFAHRYAMIHPARVARVVVGAAGWYTFPDQGVRYPRGLAESAGGAVHIAAPDFLRIPMAVVVGNEDTVRDAALNLSPRIDRQQGVDRRERGWRWIGAMRHAARERSLATPYGYSVLPGVGHDFTRAMTEGGLGAAVFRFLFGEQGECTVHGVSCPSGSSGVLPAAAQTAFPWRTDRDCA
ncbi:alpha/beta fold hydrolase [Methyloversatilis sp. XJ19-49]|uniref:alpha/beta fold hydrolase n=1 Tax=Methyloversatilis sp. XJ19-49 TaxID=2963429 RepID=UPI00211B7E3D|nr:alpha/beta hydrolase [Methyloversatilis sp. XJ19-49]MCQ9377744.1 alpha/beta hydrolase [Methyloversatilis sp. XJ19-49]